MIVHSELVFSLMKFNDKKKIYIFYMFFIKVYRLHLHKSQQQAQTTNINIKKYFCLTHTLITNSSIYTKSYFNVYTNEYSI